MKLFNIFKKKNTNEKEFQPADASEILAKSLKERLIKLGLTPNLINNTKIHLQEIETDIEFKIIDDPESHPFVINIILSAYHPDYFPELIVEGVAGMAESQESRINDALDRYFTIFFPSLLNFLLKGEPTTSFEISDENRNENYKLYLSEIQVIGENSKTINKLSFFESIEEYIKMTLCELRNSSWIKIEFFKSENVEKIEVSCTYNNDSNKALESMLLLNANKVLPDLGMFSSKQWIFIEHSSAIHNMNHEEKINARNYVIDFEKRLDKVFDAYFMYFEQHDMLLNKLKEYSNNGEEFNLYYHFLTNIVHRVLFPQVKFTEYYISRNKSGQQQFHLYTNSKPYCLAMKYVKNNLEAIQSRGTLKILFNSWEFKSMNNLLKKGSKMEDLVSGPYTILID